MSLLQIPRDDSAAAPNSHTSNGANPRSDDAPIIPESPQANTSVAETPLVWVHPRAWKTNNRTRCYISLSERNYSRDGDFDVLRRSVGAKLQKQDARGSFYSDKEYLSGDKVDDQLGGAALLAYYLSRTGPDETIQQALEKAVRFHLDSLVFRSPKHRFCFSRYFNDRDTAGDWCNTLWCLSHGNVVLRHGEPFLTKETMLRLRGVMDEFWSFVSTFPTRDENPCHNQLLAYCKIGIIYGRNVGRPALVADLIKYYRERLRPLRIRDRGYLIYSEFNEWDSHYGVLSWSFLEYLFLLTGDPVFAEDAQQMAIYFNEQVSAGGYCWGGPRNNESGVDEFPHLLCARARELGLDRLLFPEPSHLWHRLVVGGHGGAGLVARIEFIFPGAKAPRALIPTPWHFQDAGASVSLTDDTRLHHLSSAGLELIPVAGMGALGSGLRWSHNRAWKQGPLQVLHPKPSEALRYQDSKPIKLSKVVGIASMQRGYQWETRQWWLSSGKNLLWIGQLITHAFPQCDQIDFLLGTPVLTRLSGKPVPVSEVENAEGLKADTQGSPLTVLSQRFLQFGDVYVGASAPVEFVRLSEDAFHTFPTQHGQSWRSVTSSNHLRVIVADKPKTLECRQSLFFAVEIGTAIPSLIVNAGPDVWSMESKSGIFRARQTDGIWSYAFGLGNKEEQLPQIGFGFRRGTSSK